MKNDMLGKNLEAMWDKTTSLIDAAVTKNPTCGLQYLLHQIVEAAADKEETAVMVSMLNDIIEQRTSNRQARRAERVAARKEMKRAETH